MRSPSNAQGSEPRVDQTSIAGDRESRMNLPETVRLADRVSPHIEGSLRAMRFKWGGRPLDFFALALLVLGAQSATFGVIDAFAGRGTLSPGLVVARYAPMLLLIVIVALLTAFKTSCLTVTPSQPGRRRRTD